MCVGFKSSGHDVEMNQNLLVIQNGLWINLG